MTIEEMRAAYLVGVRRHRIAKGRGSKHLVGWRMNIPEEVANGYSAVSEALVSEEVGGRWIASESDWPDDGVDVIGPDGRQYGVRWTPRPNGGCIVRAKDRADVTMILVVGIPPGLTIVGSLPTLDAKSDWFYRRDWDPPAWLVPGREFRPL